jgi:hypothetical protein
MGLAFALNQAFVKASTEALEKYRSEQCPNPTRGKSCSRKYGSLAFQIATQNTKYQNETGTYDATTGKVVRRGVRGKKVFCASCRVEWILIITCSDDPLPSDESPVLEPWDELFPLFEEIAKPAKK